MTDHFNLYPWYERIPQERLSLIIRNACLISRPHFHKLPIWTLVGNLFGEGSTVALDICRYAKVDGNAKVRAERARAA